MADQHKGEHREVQAAWVLKYMRQRQRNKGLLQVVMRVTFCKGLACYMMVI